MSFVPNVVTKRQFFHKSQQSCIYTYASVCCLILFYLIFSFLLMFFFFIFSLSKYTICSFVQSRKINECQYFYNKYNYCCKFRNFEFRFLLPDDGVIYKKENKIRECTYINK